MTPQVADLPRLARTIAHLRPQQVLHRARLVAQRRVVGARPDAFAHRWTVSPDGPVGLPPAFRAVDATALAHRWALDDLSTGSFTFLDERRELGNPPRWDPADASQLWLFHHHYWEWAWSLAAHPDRDAARAVFAAQWRSWRDQTSFGRWNAWAAYPASLRAWVLVNVYPDLVAGSDLDDLVIADLGLHAGFLAHNVELDVGGNHVMKNIKALVGLAVFLGRTDLLDTGLDHLRREVAVQVLADGGHYELSPSYHCQVLADLVDVSRLLARAGHAPLAEVDDAIARMRRWIGLMLMPDGDVPLFNDCEPVSAGLLDLLEPGPRPEEGLHVLPHSGYVVVRHGPFHLVADVGQPGPPDLPGHIHADCLSFELAVEGRRVVVDTGTSEYGSGPRRHRERSTAAHNTIEVDGVDQTEVWGAFRAGRRATATLERAQTDGDRVVVTASHDGYRHLPGAPLHRRTWTVGNNAMSVRDEVIGSGRHHVASRLHLPAEVATDGVSGPDGDVLAHPPLIAGLHVEGPEPTDGAGQPLWQHSTRAVGFGALRPGYTVTFRADVELPVTLRSEIVIEAKECPDQTEPEPGRLPTGEGRYSSPHRPM